MKNFLEMIWSRMSYHSRYVWTWATNKQRQILLSDYWDEVAGEERMKEVLVDRYYFGSGNHIMLHNNDWGRSKLKGRLYEQSTFITVDETKPKVAWSHNPVINAKGVIGYPSILIGAGGFGGTSTDKTFPIQLSEIEELSIYYDVKMKNDNMKFNLAFDFWICDKLTGKRLAEIMVWEDYNIAQPFGKKRKSFGEYNVRSGYMNRPDVGENEGWEFIAFVRKRNLRRQNGTIDLEAMLRWLIINKLIPGEWIYDNLMGIEFGTEVYNSTGVTLVEFFEVKLNTNPNIK